MFYGFVVCVVFIVLVHCRALQEGIGKPTSWLARLRGLASAEGQILPFPIDFDSRPYNTFTLPFERVIAIHKSSSDLRRRFVHVNQ